MAKLLTKVPVFAGLASKEPPRLPAPKSKKLFWGSWMLCIIVSFLTALFTLSAHTLISAFETSLYDLPQLFFGSYAMNVIVFWAVLNGIFLIVWFWFIHQKVNRKNGVTDEMIGWKIDRKSLLKTFGLAFTMIALFYAIIALARWAFQTDFRIFTLAFKTFSPDKLVTLLLYLPLFFIFYLANSLQVNGMMRIEGMSEKKNLILCGLGTVLGCTILWAIQYDSLVLTSTHQTYWPTAFVSILVLTLCIPQLFVAALLNRYFFKATGKVWLGAVVNTLVFTMFGVMNTSIAGVFL